MVFPTAPARGPIRFRRGFYLLPSMFTIANMFCGYACIVHAMRGHYEVGATFIGIAGVLDMLDGRIARATNTTSAFGLELDSLADVISFGLAPAILAFSWGLTPLGRLGWAVGFLFVTAAALRLARFNIQSPTGDKRYFVGLPSPAAAAVPASSVFAYPVQLTEPAQSVVALGIVLVPAVLTLMVVSSAPATARPQEPASNIIAIVAGNARMDEAKMTGMTPPVFTFKGMCVLVPPYCRRPMTRFAYCTVTRRWPRSTKMIAATTAVIITSRNTMLSSPS